jgi:hypothetical protein
MKANFYECAPWTGELEEVPLPMLEKCEVRVVEDSEHLIHW